MSVARERFRQVISRDTCTPEDRKERGHHGGGKGRIGPIVERPGIAASGVMHDVRACVASDGER